MALIGNVNCTGKQLALVGKLLLDQAFHVEVLELTIRLNEIFGLIEVGEDCLEIR